MGIVPGKPGRTPEVVDLTTCSAQIILGSRLQDSGAMQARPKQRVEPETLDAFVEQTIASS